MENTMVKMVLKLCVLSILLTATILVFKQNVIADFYSWSECQTTNSDNFTGCINTNYSSYTTCYYQCGGNGTCQTTCSNTYENSRQSCYTSWGSGVDSCDSNISIEPAHRPQAYCERESNKVYALCMKTGNPPDEATCQAEWQDHFAACYYP